MSALEVLLDPHEAHLKPASLGLRLLERDVSGDRDVLERGRPKALLTREANVFDRFGIEPDDVRANGVETDGVVAHDDQAEVEGDRRQHAAGTGGDGVDGDELRLNDVLEIGDLFVQPMIVIDQPMAVVLDANVVLHREGHRGPRVRLELRAIDKKVGASDRLGREDVVAKTRLVSEGDLDLGHLLEVVMLDAGALENGVITSAFEGRARGNRDAAALSDCELGHAAIAILQCEEYAFQELRPRVSILEHRPRGHAVRLEERATMRLQPQLFETLADDLADRVDVVTVAPSDDDLGRANRFHCATAYAIPGRPATDTATRSPAGGPDW